MKTTLLALASIALLNSAAFAADDQTTKPATAESNSQRATFAQRDKNHDGKISKEEAASDTLLTEEWDELDEDKSGGIDVTEFSMFEPKSEVEVDEEEKSAY